MTLKPANQDIEMPAAPFVRRSRMIDIGWTFSAATLAPVDNYLVRIRRKLIILSAPSHRIQTPTGSTYGFSAYDPKRVVQHLEIFRVYTNYIQTASKGVTPARNSAWQRVLCASNTFSIGAHFDARFYDLRIGDML